MQSPGLQDVDGPAHVTPIPGGVRPMEPSVVVPESVPGRGHKPYTYIALNHRYSLL